jgi:hypothetical protein
MTKAEIISFVANNLKKVDKTNKYHPVVIEKAITLAFNQGYSEIFDKDPRLLDNYTKTYGGAGTTIAIAANANTDIYESAIPEEYVPFRDKNSGIRNIATETQSVFKFYPASKREFEILPNTLVGELNANDTRGYYTVRSETIEYYGVASVAAAGVRMDIVIPFDKYASADVILIPFAKDKQLIDMVIETMRGMPQVDLKDNNADTE